MSITNGFWKSTLFCLACAALLLSACAPLNAPTATLVSIAVMTPSPVPSTSTPVPTALPPNCKIVDVARICIQDIARSYNTRVTLRIWAGTSSLDISPDFERNLPVELLDEQGRSYAITDFGLPSYTEGADYYDHALSFELVPDDVKELTLSLPVVSIENDFGKSYQHSPVPDIQVDFGEHPKPGESKPLDITRIIAGQTFHFVKVAFEGDGVNSLIATLSTDPLSLPDELDSVSPMLGNHEKQLYFGGKGGISGRPFETYADLVIPPGKSSGLTQNTYITGVVDLKVGGIYVGYRGPFELKYTLP